MFKSQVYFSALILLLILSLFKYELHFDRLEKKSIHLRIAILSARENYHKRSTIRKSWMKSIEIWNKIFQQSNFPWKIDAKFILGTNSCNINPIERKSIYSCEEICPLSIESIAIGRSEYLFKHIKTIGKNFPFNGFSLQSYHSIVIKRVGIINSLNKLNNKLKILNAIDKKALLEIDLINFSEDRDSFYYQEIEFRLESNYPVLILIENVSLRNSHHLHLISQLNSSFCYIAILRSYYGFNDFESMPFIDGQHFIPFNLEIEIITQSQSSHSNHSDIWRLRLTKLQKSIDFESKLYNDLIQINLIDVYRNLPRKLLEYLRTLTLDNPDVTHLLKTDDDCYLNISNIVELIAFHHRERFTWFGNFRRLWPINYYGKWSDNAYTSPYYPLFACGSGYILTRDLINWISTNVDHLHPYQGEDVSMGIWLSAINHKKIQDERWICGNEFQLDMSNLLSLPQTTMLKL